MNEEGLGDGLWARAFMGAASQEEVSTLKIRANQPISMAVVRYLAMGYLQQEGSGLECESQRKKGSGMLEGKLMIISWPKD